MLGKASEKLKCLTSHQSDVHAVACQRLDGCLVVLQPIHELQQQQFNSLQCSFTRTETYRLGMEGGYCAGQSSDSRGATVWRITPDSSLCGVAVVRQQNRNRDGIYRS